MRLRIADARVKSGLRALLFLGLIVTLIGSGILIASLRSGAIQQEDFVYWTRITLMGMAVLICVLPLAIWAVFRVNLLGIPQVRLMFPLVGMPIGYSLLGTEHIRPGFYEVTAQVLPVLLLALAVEFRAFGIQSKADWSRDALGKLPAASIILLLLGGEFISLIGVATPDMPAYSARTVAGAITVGFLAVLMLSVLGDFPDRKAEATSEP